MSHAGVSTERRISPVRVVLAALLLIGLVAAGVFGARMWSAYAATQQRAPWFAGYVDVTNTPTYAFEQMGASTHRNAMLSFIVSSPKKACTPSWGAAYTLGQASSALDLDRRIARLRQAGGDVAVSFGGQANSDLALKCTTPTSLVAAYRSVVTRYSLTTIDLDIEGGALSTSASAAADRRATAIATLQKERRASHTPLAVWVTLPVSPDGLTADGAAAVSRLLAAGVDLAGVNAMTMNYGSSRAKGQSMLAASTSALTALDRQLGVLYDRAKLHQSAANLWQKIGATPMIGQNDSPGEVFTVAAARSLNTFALAHGLGRMSMWSANRDATCGSNYVTLTIVSNGCSGVNERGQSFASALGAHFSGRMVAGASSVTSAAPATTVAPDNPATSPYPIWTTTANYLQGTKITWHHNVYEAKWWTSGDLPDNPVLNSWQTPWQLIGPVLAGEHPIAQPTLPPGTVAAWSGTKKYKTGAHVLFHGVPYVAKWWNTGDSPAAASSDASGSPWAALTAAQFAALQKAASK